MQLWPASGFSAECSNSTDGQFKRPLYLGAVGFRRVEFRRKENCSQCFTDVAVALGERSCHTINQCARRSVRNKMTCKLGGDKLRRRGMMGEYVEYHQTIF